MSDEGRRVFSTKTVLKVINGVTGKDVTEMLGYLAQREVPEGATAAVSPMAKAWLYSQNTELMKAVYSGSSDCESWMQEQLPKLGENVSTTPIPAHEVASINSVIDMLDNAQAAVDEAEARADAVEGAADAAAKAEKKVAELEKKATQLEEKNKELTAQLAELKKEVAAFAGKVAIDQTGLESSIKDIVTSAVKAAAGSFAGGAAAVAAAGAEEASAAGDANATDSQGDVPDDFGFGASGASDEGFGF